MQPKRRNLTHAPTSERQADSAPGAGRVGPSADHGGGLVVRRVVAFLRYGGPFPRGAMGGVPPAIPPTRERREDLAGGAEGNVGPSADHGQGLVAQRVVASLRYSGPSPRGDMGVVLPPMSTRREGREDLAPGAEGEVGPSADHGEGLVAQRGVAHKGSSSSSSSNINSNNSGSDINS